MSTWLLTYQQSVLSYSRVTNISKSFTYRMSAKTPGIDMERNYVTVTLRIPMYVLTFRDLCVCCCVGHQHEPRINGSTDEMSFEEDTRVSLRTMFYVGVHSGATWQIRRIDLCGGGDAVCRYHYWNNFYNRPFTVPVRPTPHKKNVNKADKLSAAKRTSLIASKLLRRQHES